MKEMRTFGIDTYSIECCIDRNIHQYEIVCFISFLFFKIENFSIKKQEITNINITNK